MPNTKITKPLKRAFIVKYIVLVSVLLLSSCAGPGDSSWGITPANSDICPSGKSVSGQCR
ncbi:hypothetical protein DQY79_07100 [Salmonella enterica subsp. enterica serovar Virchow]|nr:hypothetical protein [Salmonella enterica subsp. enterica serovar Virchow]